MIKAHRIELGLGVTNVPWEGVFWFQSKPTWRMLEIFPGVNKSPEWDQPACERCHSRQLSETYPVWSSNTKKLEVCKETKSSNTCRKSHVIITFTSWHKVLTPENLPLIFYLTKMFDSLKSWNTFPYTIWEGDTRQREAWETKIQSWFSSRPLPACEL